MSRLRKLGLELPEPPSPLGAYVPTVEVGSLLFLSGMLPSIQRRLAFVGRFGAELTISGWA
jgi:enamine deaminase RidA (YjgF/YER057c/UK114 family)